jgi:hypothetical protein
MKMALRALRSAELSIETMASTTHFPEIEKQIAPIDIAKVIAVDVEYRNCNTGLDLLDDVDIIVGVTDENHDSDHHIAILTLDGKLAADYEDSSWPENLSPLRVLLIYALPKGSKTIKLGYWD